MANAIAAVVLAAGLWLSYRAVNFPKFADFLIAVEAEMNKVSWPTRGDLVRSSLVVLFVILAMAGLLFLFDVIWKFLFEMLGVLKTFKESSGS
ncbi:MAG: preprotein translocase subunit SecE [Planctomycetota bacterium]